MRVKSGAVILTGLLALGALTACSSPCSTATAQRIATSTWPSHISSPEIRSADGSFDSGFFGLRCYADAVPIAETLMQRVLLRLPPPHSVLAPVDSVAVLVCHYSGSNTEAPMGTLLGTTIVKDPAHLAALFNESTRRKPHTGWFGCGADDGAFDQLMFVSPSQGWVYVSVPRVGCFQGMRSTLVGGDFDPNTALRDAMEALDAGYPAL